MPALDHLRTRRTETEQFKKFTFDDLMARDKASLDIFWLKDESLEDLENLPPPATLAAEIVEELEAILEEYHSARFVFNGRVRHAWQTLGPQVTSARMLKDYEERYYGPALEGGL